MATLTISHYIYLTKEERYKLHEKNSIETIGISVPVWFHKGTTSEPAKEIFCKYILTNNIENKPIESNLTGYTINIPQLEPSENTNLAKLLNREDGGHEGLEFRQYNKINIKNKEFNIVHFIEIKDIQLLNDTIS